jgi:predicted RNA binding protein YcfA (HicA-like mRNA interferase family)
VHKGRDIPRPFVRAILKQARLSVDEFVALL